MVEYADRLVFANQFTALWQRALKDSVTPQLREALAVAGFDLQHPKATYTVPVWEQCLVLTAAALYPHSTKRDAYIELGNRMVQSYFDNVWGQHFLTLQRMLGHRRMLPRIQSIFRMSNNFTLATVVEVEPNLFHVWINDVGDEIYFTQGVIQAGTSIGEAVPRNVDIIQSDPHGVTFAVRIDGR